jgi:Caspase domain
MEALFRGGSYGPNPLTPKKQFPLSPSASVISRRRFLAVGLTLAVACATRPGHSQSVSSTRAAVIVGVDRVRGLPELRAASSGATAVAKWLKDEGLDVTLLVDDDRPVLAENLKIAIKTLVNRGTLDQLIIYFAGHGFVSGGNSEFWLLSNALDDPNEAVSLTESHDRARQFGIKNVVFISDACRSRADSLPMEGVRGQIVFPTSRSASNVRCDVDKFLATRIGDPAYETSVDKSTANYRGIYTTCFLEAFKRPYASMVETVEGKPVVPNRRLRDYLEQEVPKKARAASITLNQLPDAEICSDDSFIGHVSTTDRLAAAETGPPTLSDVASAAIGTEVGGGSLQKQNVLHSPAASSFLASARTIAEASVLSDHLEAPSGLVVSGALLASVTVGAGVEANFKNFPDLDPPSALVEVPNPHAGSVALRFSDGTGTVLAILAGFVSNVVVDRGAVASVTLVPSRQTWRWQEYESERERIDQLHAAVATAARYGVFRIEGPAGTRERSSAELASRIRVLKSIDPTLGLYAAYAYNDAGNIDQVLSVRRFMREDLDLDLFDVAMLAGEISGQTPHGPFPFCPMLSQGWGLLRVKNVPLPRSIKDATQHLRRSLWTMLDEEGMQLVIDALRKGEVI